LLLTGVERVALGAELDVQILLRGTRVELVPARAVHVGERVFGVDSCLHRALSLEKWASVADSTLWPSLERQPGTTGATRCGSRSGWCCSSAPPWSPCTTGWASAPPASTPSPTARSTTRSSSPPPPAAC